MWFRNQVGLILNADTQRSSEPFMSNTLSLLPSFVLNLFFSLLEACITDTGSAGALRSKQVYIKQLVCLAYPTNIRHFVSFSATILNWSCNLVLQSWADLMLPNKSPDTSLFPVYISHHFPVLALSLYVVVTGCVIGPLLALLLVRCTYLVQQYDRLLSSCKYSLFPFVFPLYFSNVSFRKKDSVLIRLHSRLLEFDSRQGFSLYYCIHGPT